MSLNNDDILKLAKLAKLKITDNEKSNLLNDLNNILKMIEKMQAIDTSDIEPLNHPHELFQRLREDKVTNLNERDKFQEISPLTKKGFFLVPKVIE